MSPDLPTETIDSPRTAGQHDAIWLISFGGPEAPEEVVPFLENVTRGQGIPKERLEVVGEHYFGFGGKSPINDQNRALIAALRTELDARGCHLPIIWGNRNWRPFISEAVAESVSVGHRRVVAVMTSAYPSYSGCRSYREAIRAELDASGATISVDRIGNYALDDGFITANADALAASLTEAPEARVVFVTHSIPTPMDETSGPDGGAYLAWHKEVARRVLDRVGHIGEHDLVFCSRSGRPSDPWLEPDVNDHLEDLATRGVVSVVLAPIGFISDHMEVIYDLDTQARETCDRLGISMVRAATAGTHPAFVSALADRILDRLAAGPGALPGICTPTATEGCCPNLRRPQTPAID